MPINDPVESAASSVEMTCPKCDLQQAPGESCVDCGISTAATDAAIDSSRYLLTDDPYRENKYMINLRGLLFGSRLGTDHR